MQTLKDLRAWHNQQASVCYVQAHEAAGRALDGRSGHSSRQKHLAEQQACKELEAIHIKAVTILDKEINK